MSATVIKDFLVAIGFKSDSTGAKKMNDELVSVENRVKLLQQAFIGMATSIVGAVAKTSGEMEKLYYSSQRIGASAGNIRAFQGAISQMGGSAEGAMQSMEALAQKIRQSPGMEKMVQGIGVATREANGEMRDQVEMYKDFHKQFSGMDYYRANAYGNAFGWDENTLMAIRDPAFAKNLDKYQALQKSMGMNDDLAKSGKEFATEWRDLMMMSKALAEVIIMTAGQALIPVFKAINSGLQAAIKWFGNLDPGIKKFLATALKIGTLIVVFGGLFGAISKLARVLPILRGLIFLIRGLSLAFFMSPIGIVLALAAAIALLWNDYQVWKEGGKSLIDWTLWKSGIDAAKEGITDLIKRMELLIKAGAALASRDFRLAKQLWDQATGGDPWEEKAPPPPPKPPVTPPAASPAQTSSTTTAPSTMDNVLTAGKEAAKIVAGNVVDLAQKISLVGISNANAAVVDVVKNGDAAANEVKKGLGDTVSSQNQDSTYSFSFGKNIDAYIKEASVKYGIPEDILRGFVHMEDGWYGKMSKSGALGVGQFVQGTWNGLAAEDAGKALGMVRVDKSNFRKANDPRRNDYINTMAMGLLAQRNATALKDAGLPVTGENLYMTHNIGATGFIHAIKGIASKKELDNMNLNGRKGNMTPQQFVEFQKKRYNKSYAKANAKEDKSEPKGKIQTPKGGKPLAEFAEKAEKQNITSYSPPASVLLPLGYSANVGGKNVVINQSHKTDITINGAESPQLTANRIQNHEDNVATQMARNARSIFS